MHRFEQEERDGICTWDELQSFRHDPKDTETYPLVVVVSADDSAASQQAVRPCIELAASNHTVTGHGAHSGHIRKILRPRLGREDRSTDHQAAHTGAQHHSSRLLSGWSGLDDHSVSQVGESVYEMQEIYGVDSDLAWCPIRPRVHWSRH